MRSSEGKLTHLGITAPARSTLAYANEHRPWQLYRAAARRAVFDFIEGWYNPHRRHSALDYESPISYERKHDPAA